MRKGAPSVPIKSGMHHAGHPNITVEIEANGFSDTSIFSENPAQFLCILKTTTFHIRGSGVIIIFCFCHACKPSPEFPLRIWRIRGNVLKYVVEKHGEKDNPLRYPQGSEEKEIIERELSRKFISLRFPGWLEKAFREYHFRNTRGFMKYSLILGFFFFVTFGVLDYMAYPGIFHKLWLIRLAVGCPLILISIAVLYFARNDRVVQGVYSFVILLVGAGSLAMIFVTSHDVTHKYYAGLVITIYYGYVVSGMRFWYATFAGSAITLSYALTALVFLRPTPEFVGPNLFFLSSANFTGMLGNFLIEESKRKEFLQSALLKFQRRRLEAANKELKTLSDTDALTGLANRRYLEEFLQREWKRAMRHKYPIALLMIDIDYFKEYNDSLGHQAGDRCLVRLAEVLKGFERRPGDLAARFGGEEFVMVLCGTDVKGAMEVARQISKRVYDLKIKHPSSEVSEYVTVSIGGAGFIPSPHNLKEELIELADQAMYRAKAQGRAQIVAAEP